MAGMLTKPSDIILGQKLLYISPPAAAKKFYTPARLCFCRNNMFFSSSSGVNRGRLVLSVPQKYNNNAPDSSYCYLTSSRLLEKKTNKPFVLNNHQLIINSSCDSSSSRIVSNKLDEIKKTVVRILASSLLFGFLAFMTIPTRRCSAYAGSYNRWSTSTSSTSLPSLSCSCTPSTSNKEANTSKSPKDNESSPATGNVIESSPATGNVIESSPATGNVIESSPTKDPFEKLLMEIITEIKANTSKSPKDNESSPTTGNVIESSPTKDPFEKLFEEFLMEIITEITANISKSPKDNESSPTTGNVTKDRHEEKLIKIFTKIIKILVFIILFPLSITLFAAVITGYGYYLKICKDDKEKSVLMLQVGVLDKTRELRREVGRITQIANTSNLNGMKLKEVVKTLLQRYDSCHFAHLSVTQCISDETKYGNIFSEMKDSIDKDSEALVDVYDIFTYFAKSLAIFIHSSLKKAIKKINYDDKSAKQLFGEILSRELVKYDRDEETFANVDSMEYEAEAVGKEHCRVDIDYLVVTILVLASGVYSIPPLECNTEHVKTVLQKFNTIPKSKLELLEVLLTPQMEDEGLSEEGLEKDFPLLKPLN